MKLSDLSAAGFRDRLRLDGVFLRTGEFVYRIQSHVAYLAEPFRQLYADFLFIEHCDFSDFHLEVSKCRPLSEWFRPHVTVRQLGHFETTPVPVDQSVAYLEWSLNRCVFAQVYNRLLLHGAVLAREGRAVVIAGNSGAGKSTLAAALALNGWRLLSDELTVVSPTDGSLMSLARPVALKNQSIELIQSLADDAYFGPVAVTTAKGRVAHMRAPVSDPSKIAEPAWPACFVFVNFQAGKDITVQEVSRAQAFTRLAELAGINYGVLGELGFDTLSRAVDSALCLDLEYGSLDQAMVFFDSEYSAILGLDQPTPAVDEHG